MSLHAFTLILDQDAQPFLKQLNEAGCHDAIFQIEEGVPVAHFHREAPTLQRAIATAARAICSTELDVVGVGGVASQRADD
jgi:acetyl-CoA acetyltransferase